MNFSNDKSRAGTTKPVICKTLTVVDDHKGVGTEITFGYHVRQFKCKNGCSHYNHMVCAVCGSYSYIDSEALEDFQDQLARENGFKPTKCKLQIYGVCKECR